jgi:hypothetical protein
MVSKQFPFKQVSDENGSASFMPFLPLTLFHGSSELEVSGLLDTGATVNVMPYQIGLRLGAVWEEQTTSLRLSGNLANWEARGLIVTAKVADFKNVRLVFAWTISNEVPVILGQVNFFMSFNVCFYREQLYFDIERAAE